MSNSIGKFLVFLQLSLSVMCLSWSAVVYWKWTDWGWQKPRQDLNKYVASEFDTRVAQYNRVMLNYRDVHYVHVKPAQVEWLQASAAFPENTLYYDAELARLRADRNPIDVKEFKQVDQGNVSLDPPGSRYGKAVPEVPVADIKKSLKVYEEDLAKIRKDYRKAGEENLKWIEKTAAETRKINGLDELGNQVRPSLLELREEEVQIQRQADAEYESLFPQSLEAIKEADNYRERYLELKKKLEQKKKALNR